MKRLILALILAAAPALAVNPDEVLDDPAMEARARAISAELRCVVCRGENIDESNAAIARDLRLLVRERLVAGDTNDEVIDFVVDRYGEYVLMKPTTGGANILLWGAGPALFLIAAAGAIIYLRGRSTAKAPGADGLSDAEQARLDELLNR
ncbi:MULTISPECIES: cytochrome c-type biogenesis protein [Maritimibacter]|uniref:Cytochrome c-type biogenesis protein n=1 Tax=Maritimibacter alkaliphilus HTCC2654 TaxID=314271 RepID=A3VDH3_9RHOB|nr:MULTISPECIES: cytochrome c-type biogenesis protein [Maritimibacter]EAQ13562.1 Cytochrome c maturation protein, CcmH [Maritimibacter alkaliphilus HTCC2654]TYP83403.1 cytochrome c-type biogenesis protein CcmH [Maritimibacter alkaliphilus HTCC2654]